MENQNQWQISNSKSTCILENPPDSMSGKWHSFLETFTEEWKYNPALILTWQRVAQISPPWSGADSCSYIRIPEFLEPFPVFGPTFWEYLWWPGSASLSLHWPCTHQPLTWSLSQASPPTDGVFVDAPVTAWKLISSLWAGPLHLVLPSAISF